MFWLTLYSQSAPDDHASAFDHLLYYFVELWWHTEEAWSLCATIDNSPTCTKFGELARHVN